MVPFRQISPTERAKRAMPSLTLYFCGSCGCHEPSQDHGADCVWDDRTPRVAVAYVPHGETDAH